MSTVLILTPIIIGSWPLITAAAVGAAAALGLTAAETVKESVKESLEEVQQEVEVELENSEVLAENLATGKEIVLNKGNIEIRISRDERGRCTVCAKGKGHTKAELKQIAKEFSQKMTQCFIYNRVKTELKNKNFHVVNEEVMEDNAVRINVRHWVE